MTMTDVQITQPSEPLTGRALAFAAARDFSRFFHPAFPFEVGARVGAVNMPCVRKDSTGSYILIPREMADEVIESPDRLIFHLLMLGHEIAHLAHKHLDGADSQTNDEYLTLELWADFYGAKVAMTLLTYGEQVRLQAHRFWPHRSLPRLLLDVGSAVAMLLRHVYREHRKYPMPIERAGITSNGILSFVRNYYGGEFNLGFYYSVPLRILFSNEFTREVIRLDGGRTEFASSPILRAAEWHRKVQASAPAITPGFLPPVLPYLHTSFSHSDEEIEETRRILMDELKKSGILGDDFEEDNLNPSYLSTDPPRDGD